MNGGEGILLTIWRGCPGGFQRMVYTANRQYKPEPLTKRRRMRKQKRFDLLAAGKKKKNQASGS